MKFELKYHTEPSYQVRETYDIYMNDGLVRENLELGKAIEMMKKMMEAIL